MIELPHSPRTLRELVDRERLRRMHPIRAAFTLLLCLPILIYRLGPSRLLPRVCRFHLSCSVYALGALQIHGPLKGSYLAARRIVRCHPFHPGGYDPVPEATVRPTPAYPEPPACDSAAPPPHRQA